MGFWSTLGTIAGDVGGSFIGDPLLGNQVMGVVNSLSDPAGDVGTVLGKDAQASAAGRLEQAKAQQAQDRNAIDLYRTQLQAPSVAANQAIRGALMKNLQDATISGLPSYIHVPQMSGGLRPSAIGPDRGAIGSALESQARGTLANMRPLTAPTLTPLPNASLWDRIASTGGRAGSLLGALGPLLRGFGGGGNSGIGDVAGNTFDPELLADSNNADLSSLFPNAGIG